MEALLQHGVLGIMCMLLVGWIWYKDKQHLAELKELRASQQAEVKELRGSLSAEQAERIGDAQQFTTTALELQGKVIESVGEIRGIVEEYGRLGDVVGELVAVLKRRNGDGGS